MHDYSRCYATLGVTPHTDWKTLRARYKRLISQWHPDRYSADPAGKEIAEERSKQITLAYQTLDRYRRDHGTLPPAEPAEQAVDALVPAPAGDTTPDRTGPRDHPEAREADAAVDKLSRRRPGRRVVVALFVLIAAYFLVHRFAFVDIRTSENPQRADGAYDPVAAPQPRPVAEGPREAHGIVAGSTFGEVQDIQGIPTLAQGDTWHYGKSQIRFAKGRVVSWDEHPDSPLQIARDQSIQSYDGIFEVGSTKDKVRTIQGTPVTETETVWDYGPSRVYFKHNRVVGWEESPMQPLRVAR